MQQVRWAEFELQELFESSNGDFDIQKVHINNLGNYVITAGLSNNGIIGKTDVKAKIFEANTITVDMFGNAFYRQFCYKMVTHARVFSLKTNFGITQKQGMFFASALHFLKYKFGYENMCSWAKVKNEKIQLPIRDGEIDFDFMENFIAELNAQRLAELNVYLSVTGLKDYTLSIAEQQALKDFEQGKIVWGEFELQELFEIKNTLSFNKDRLVSGEEYDYITRTSQNQGVLQTTGFVNKENINPAGTWSLGLLQMDFFYREKPWYAGQFVRKIAPKIDLSKKATVFFSTILNKQKQSLLSVLVRDVDAVFEKTKISLPIKSNSNLDKISQIDFAFMQTFISAVQKLVIKDVVLYADREIAATEQIIQR